MFSPSLTRMILRSGSYNKSRRKPYERVKKIPFVIPKEKHHDNPDDDDVDSEDEDGKGFKFPPLFGRNDADDVYSEKNHIYFKTDVNENTIDKLSLEIDHVVRKINNKVNDKSYGTIIPKPIFLHISTPGGDLLSSFFMYDKIKNCQYPIHTIIEGSVASAGSVIALGGSRRYMTENSYLLIHQLSSGVIGTFENIIDEKTNCSNFMKRLVNIYYDNCGGKMTKTKIKEYLKRDLFWDSKTAIENGLVDAIWKNNFL